MSYRRTTKMAVPAQTTLHGPRYGGTVSVTRGKPPKLRFKPGTAVKLDGQLYWVVYVYRVREEPHEWFYALEECRAADEVAHMVAALGAGSDTPRIVYEIFRDHGDACKFFMDIPMNADRWTVPNKKMLQAKVVETSDERRGL